MLPKILFKCPEVTVELAHNLQKLIDSEYTKLTGKKNTYKEYPLFCASTGGVLGYWSLECNNPEIDVEFFSNFAKIIRDKEYLIY